MTLLQSIVLGAVQGIAEFLPISSSGHLRMAEYFFKQSDVPIIFDIMLHIATLAAVCLVFRKTIFRLLAALSRFILRKSNSADKEDLKLICSLILSTTITGIIGFLIKDTVKKMPVRIIPIFFILTGVILLLSSIIIKRNRIKSINVAAASFFIGAAQGISIIPGISRSGSTISTAIFTGMPCEKAGEFSFLLSIPAILGAFILELKSAGTMLGAVSLPVLIAGLISAFAVGYISLVLLLKLIKSGKLGYFSLYLIPLGVALKLYFIFFAD